MDDARTQPQSWFRTYAVAAFAFAAAYLGARGIVEIASLPVWLRLAAAAVPVAVFIVAVVALARALRLKSDELERRIQLEALALGFLCTFGLLIGLGLAEMVVTLPPDDLSYRHIWAALPIFYAVGYGRARGRYA